jgi:hypothetical protein
MSGFSADWLSLREGADHRARNVELRDAVCAMFAGRERASIVDLACGTGSNLRALAAHLPERQRWRLVDHDPGLLAAARRALCVWADVVEQEEPLVLRKGVSRLEIVFDDGDLAAFDGAVLEQGADLVAAAAFFDLVSKRWIENFCGELASRRLPLYAALSYDGVENWSPPHAADAAMLDAFHQHQTRDKGFGRAGGPRGAAILQEALEALGYAAAAGRSPWRLDARDAALIEALADGAASAVRETGRVVASTVEDWRQSRRRATRCEIGHTDLLARLPETTNDIILRSRHNPQILGRYDAKIICDRIT